MEYAAAVCYPNLEYTAHDNDMVQHNAVKFISRLKGGDSITSALESLYWETVAARRGKARHSLLPKLLANNKNHNSLINAYDDLMNETNERTNH